MKTDEIDSIEFEIYHYRDGSEWVPFSLNQKDGGKWNFFCLQLLGEHPTYEDYSRFMRSLNIETS